MRALTVKVTGSGQVRATTRSFSCRTQCRQDLDAGASATLVAVPDDGFRFDGWQGDCSGSNECTVRLDADRTVSAVFSRAAPPPPGTVRVSISFTGTGTGRVTSAPSGIDCPGSCSMNVTTGTTVAFSARADANSTFAGFGGACSGQSCSFAATADTQASADFEANLPPPPPPPLPPQCAALSPSVTTPVVAAQRKGAVCSPGLGNARGTLGLETRGSPNGFTLFVLDENTAVEKGNTGGNYSGGFTGGFTQQPDGFTALVRAVLDPRTYSAHYWRWDGIYVSAGQTLQGLNVAWHPVETSGIVIAGDFAAGSGSRHQLRLLDQSGGLQWAVDLAAPGPVFGLGSDVTGNVLVITGGGQGRITAQWLDRNGTVLSGEFEIVTGFVPGPDTWFETAPLIGGGVAIRRVDQQNDSTGRPYLTASWLGTLAVGKTSFQSPPSWLTSHPNTNLAITRTGKGYAALPLGGPDADCAQKIEILASDGTACGSFDASLGTGRCRTEDVTLGRDDTPIQLMPASTTPPNTCAWRWWPRALR